MATKTFVPQCVKLAKKQTRYIGKHEDDLKSNLGGVTGAQWLLVKALQDACDAVILAIPLVVETP